MSKRMWSILVVAVVVIAALALPTWAQALSSGTVSMTGPNRYSFTATGDTDDVLGYDLFCVICRNSGGLLNDIDVFYVPVGFTLSGWSYCDAMMNGNPVYDVTVSLTDPVGEPPSLTADENSPEGAAYCGVEWAPGPDMVSLDGAVVGSFVATTAIYSAPDPAAATTIVMEAGKTAYVFGVDATGAFYKVEMAGKFFWVPVSTMGPNYDKVWNGTPLPTKVVK